MKTMSFSEARANWAKTLDSVIDDQEEVVITRVGHDPVVIISLAEYESLRETAYLFGNPTNAVRLYEAMESLKRGEGVEHDLLE